MRTPRRNYRPNYAIAALLLNISILFSGPADAQNVAAVNGATITAQDVIRETAVIEADIQLQNLPWSVNDIAGLNTQVVETLIDRELLYQQAKARKIEIQPQWIERALLDLKDKAGSATDFNTYLDDTGLTEAELRERIKKGLVIRRLLRRSVLRGIRISESEMQAFYNNHSDYFIRRNEIRVRHILIAAPAKGEASQRADALLRIQAIQSRLQDTNADFPSLALDYSEDPSKSRGGDLGYLEPSQLIPAFAHAADALQPGEISDIVETRLGYHLIKMVDRIPASQMAYRNARPKIERTLRRNKENAAVTAYLRKLKAQASITQ